MDTRTYVHAHRTLQAPRIASAAEPACTPVMALQRPERVLKPFLAVLRDLISASGTGCSSRWLVRGL